MAFIFILLGTVWIVNGVIVLIGGTWRYERTIVASALTLFYLIPRTLVSVVTLTLSVRERKRSLVDK